MKCKLFTSILLGAILLVSFAANLTSVPVRIVVGEENASAARLFEPKWIYPNETEDTYYEDFGPRLDRIYISLYADEHAEFWDLEHGRIDLTDWSLPEAWMYKWSVPPYSDDIGMAGYGLEQAYFLVDVNNDNRPEKAPGYPNPVAGKNPAANADFRHALQHTLDRTYIAWSIWLGQAVPFYTPVPPAMGEYEHPNASVPIPNEPIEMSTYPQTPNADGLAHVFNLTLAAEILNRAGFFDTDDDGWRNFPVALGGDGANINLIYYAPADNSRLTEMAMAHEGWLESIGLKVDLRIIDRITCWFEVMIYKNFHLYTGEWIVERDPLHLVNYHSDYYWYPGFTRNYGRVNDTEFDKKVDELLEANTFDEALEKAFEAQVRWAYHTNGAIFGVQALGIKAYRRRYTGGTDEVPVGWGGEDKYRGQNWTSIVNEDGYGIDNFWTFLNAHPESHGWGDGPGELVTVTDPFTGEIIMQHNAGNMTMRWGFKTKSMEKPGNPLYASSIWEWKILRLIYDTPLKRDPYTFGWRPWLANDWETFTWNDSDPFNVGIKSGVRLYLGAGLAWHDGYPLTAEDVIYTMRDLPAELMDLGYGPPWWSKNVQFVKDFRLIDPWTVEVLFDVKSVFAESWVGEQIILPKHIWKELIEKERLHQQDPILYPEGVDFWGQAPDPNVIGSGPYRFVSYEETIAVLLVANKPGSTVQTSWPGSDNITSPGFSRQTIYGSIPEDIVGEYLNNTEMPMPDRKVDIKDIATAAKAFGSFPGHPRWRMGIGDINGDYKIDIKDIAAIAKKFGWVADPKYELFYEVDYMDGSRSTGNVLTYISRYYLVEPKAANVTKLEFYVDQIVTVDINTSDAEFWGYETRYNQGVDNRTLNGDVIDSKWKWVLFGRMAGRAWGYTWGNTISGNYIFIADQTIEENVGNATPDHPGTHIEGQAVTLMHEIGHSIGIINLTGGEEVYDDTHPNSVMAHADVYHYNKTIDERYSDEYWALKDLIDNYRI